MLYLYFRATLFIEMLYLYFRGTFFIEMRILCFLLIQVST